MKERRKKSEFIPFMPVRHQSIRCNCLQSTQVVEKTKKRTRRRPHPVECTILGTDRYMNTHTGERRGKTGVCVCMNCDSGKRMGDVVRERERETQRERERKSVECKWRSIERRVGERKRVPRKER